MRRWVVVMRIVSPFILLLLAPLAGASTMTCADAVCGPLQLPLGGGTTAPQKYPPGPPTLDAATAGNAQVTLTWTAPPSASTTQPPVTNYIVYRAVGGGASEQVTSGGCSGLADVRTCTDMGLTNGLSYSYTVAAVNGDGTGPASGARAATPLGPTASPTPEAAAVASPTAAARSVPPLATLATSKSTAAGGSAVADAVKPGADPTAGSAAADHGKDVARGSAPSPMGAATLLVLAGLAVGLRCRASKP